jgi:hypothetical protein
MKSKPMDTPTRRKDTDAKTPKERIKGKNKAGTTLWRIEEERRGGKR